ncbi:sensor histidine kinase [Candidatus Nitrospira nitrificans]|uniref:histidine kinase n=1 Tax=Candidatus Nitrospira nitrificans TaxID=1742973 RepID=A0A0S4LGY4_9BACT|nr:sensor histidine kinase [Candidatus Nitrospira nitrificans]CUS35978.1 putative Histidine kinase [Candidatus Nitrospira nitrificans]
MPASWNRIKPFAFSLAALMVGLVILHLATDVARSFLSLFPLQTPFEGENPLSAAREEVAAWTPLAMRILSMGLIVLPIWYFLRRHEREEELQRLDQGWAARLRARSEELSAVNNALVSEVSKRIDTEQSLEANRRDLRLLASQLLRLQEEERRRISRDLHDDINQRLALLSIDIEMLEQQLASASVDTVTTVHTIQDRIVELSENVRRLAYQFHPSILDDLGLAIALRRLVDDFQARTGLVARFVGKDIPQHVAQEVVTCLYRVAQEALANISRHARAKNVHVELRRVRDGLQLMISDDGVGFDASRDSGRRGSLGLLSMKERVFLVAGTLDIQSTRGEGTRICAWVPFKQERA